MFNYRKGASHYILGLGLSARARDRDKVRVTTIGKARVFNYTYPDVQVVSKLLEVIAMLGVGA